MIVGSNGFLLDMFGSKDPIKNANGSMWNLRPLRRTLLDHNCLRVEEMMDAKLS